MPALTDVGTNTIGSGTRIWQFVVILDGAKNGADCNICSHVFIESDVVIGSRVTVKCGVQAWDGIRIEDDVFIGPNVTLTNDKHPRSRVYPESFSRSTIENNDASIGGGAVVLSKVRIGSGATIEVDPVVTRDVEANTVVVGNPARPIGGQ